VTASRAGAFLARGSLLLTAAYPIAVYVLLDHGAVRLAGLLLAAVLALRVLRFDARRGAALALLLLAGVFAAVVLATGSELIARLYPVGVSATLLAVFGMSLASPPSIIERIARATGTELDAVGVRYTRTLTKVWCGFFLVNGAVALMTAVLSSREWWTLYNGLVSYALAGTLFVGERLVRPVLQRRMTPT
jgi:uncharacterized membrane protein